MKKYLSIFLIFFLLFSVSVPAFAETTDILPPSLESTGCDSYVISARYNQDGSVYEYFCLIYNQADWNCYVPVNKDSIYVMLLSFLESPSMIYSSRVNGSSFDPSSDNNGWGTLEDGWILDSTFDDGDIYYYASVQGDLITSNRDIPYAVFNADTKSLDYTGEFFFTLTPPLAVEVGKALTLFQTQTSQNLMIITLCGVGCLAFLISLPILRKVLLRFLNR